MQDSELMIYQGSAPSAPRNPTLPAGATDAIAIQVWLRSHRSPQTREAYAGDIEALVAFTNGLHKRNRKSES